MAKFKIYAGRINLDKKMNNLRKMDLLHPQQQIDGVEKQVEKYMYGDYTARIATQSPYIVRAVEVFSK